MGILQESFFESCSIVCISDNKMTCMEGGLWFCFKEERSEFCYLTKETVNS